MPKGYWIAQVDVRDPDAVQGYVDRVAARHGRLDILVNNAGGSPESDAATASPRFAEAITRLNLLAPYYINVQTVKSQGISTENEVSLSTEIETSLRGDFRY